MIDPQSRSLEWIEQASALIQNKQLNKLNGIKKISMEAFFYILEIEKMAD